MPRRGGGRPVGELQHPCRPAGDLQAARRVAVETGQRGFRHGAQALHPAAGPVGMRVARSSGSCRRCAVGWCGHSCPPSPGTRLLCGRAAPALASAAPVELPLHMLPRQMGQSGGLLIFQRPKPSQPACQLCCCACCYHPRAWHLRCCAGHGPGLPAQHSCTATSCATGCIGRQQLLDAGHVPGADHNLAPCLDLEPQHLALCQAYKCHV